MKSKGSQITIGVSVAAVFLGLSVLLILTACGGPGCCPRISKDNVTVDAWVCPAYCPGGGKTTVFYSVEFWRETEFCEPPANFRIYIYNVTEGKELPPLTFDTVKTGVYTGKQEITLERDTEFELRAVGDAQCGLKSVKFPVKVVNPDNIVELLRFTEKLDWPANKWSMTINTAPGVLLYQIVNINKFDIEVHHLGLNASMAAGDTWTAQAGQKLSANGLWEVEIPTRIEYDKYQNEGMPTAGVDAILRCDCP